MKAKGEEGGRRSYSERFCDVERKSKFTITRDVAKSYRIGPMRYMMKLEKRLAYSKFVSLFTFVALALPSSGRA